MIFPKRNAFNNQIVSAAQEVQKYYTKINEDPYVQGHFEKKFCNQFNIFMGGRGYSDAVNSGSSAIFIAIKSLKLKPKSFVLVPPIIDPGAINAVIENNLKLWAIDTMNDSYNVSVEKIKNCIENDQKKQISAVLIAHISGETVDFTGIKSACKNRGIKIIEDCSQAHGAEIKDIKVGNFGDIAAFSMMSRKTITANGAAGMIYTKSKSLHRTCLAIADRGKPSWLKSYDQRDPSKNLFSSLNYNLDEISSAIGCISMSKINSTIKKRRKLTKYLKEKLNSETRSVYINYNVEGSSPFIIPIFVRKGFDQNKLIKQLISKKIPLNPNYKFLITNWKYLKKKLKGSKNIKIAQKNINKSFALYINERYLEKHIKYIIETIKETEKNCVQ